MTNSGVAADRASSKNISIVLTIMLSVFVGGMAVTNQSLWIDEANSAFKAMQTSFGGWWGTMVLERGSDVQMPFYMVWLWIWAKVFGTAEIALRAANVPWFVGGVLALTWAFPQNRRLQISVLILALTNAFLWYYVSEARPYIVLFAFSALTTGCLLRLLSEPQLSLESATWFRCFCLGITGLCATSLIAVPWAIAAMTAFVYCVGARPAFQTFIRFWFFSLLLTVTVGALGVYYLWTLKVGARASDLGQTGLANVGFIFYELTGLSGLGPGRLNMREQGLQTAGAFLPFLAIAASAVAALVVDGAIEISKNISRREVVFFGIAVAGPLCLILAVAHVAHMRLLGRHLTPLLPFVLAFLALGLNSLFLSPRLWKRIVAVAVVLVSLTSALEIRFAPRHHRDDYRAAAEAARRAIADGKRVWWVANETAGAYYNLPPNPANLLTADTLSRTDLEKAEEPDLIFFSKPDIYDPSGNVALYILRHDFREKQSLPAFQFFEPPPASR